MKKKTAGVSMGIVIIFIMVMSVTTMALLVTAVSALRSANSLPRADGEYFSAEAAMNKALPGIATELSSAPANNMVQTMRTAARNVLHGEQIAPADAATTLTTSADFRIAVESAVNEFVTSAFGGTLPAALGTPGWDNQQVAITGPNRHFWFTGADSGTTNSTVFGERLEVEGFAEPAYVEVNRDGSNVALLGYGVRQERAGDTVTLYISPEIAVTSYSGGAEITYYFHWEFDGFTVNVANAPGGGGPFQNSGSYSHISGECLLPANDTNRPCGTGACGNPNCGLRILEPIPFHVPVSTTTEPNTHRPDDSVCARQGAYNALREGITRTFAGNLPTTATLGFPAGMGSGNRAFVNGEWIEIPNHNALSTHIDVPARTVSELVDGVNVTRTIPAQTLRNPSDFLRYYFDTVTYVHLQDADGHNRLSGDIHVPNLVAMVTTGRLDFAPGLNFTGRPHTATERATIIRAGGDVNIMFNSTIGATNEITAANRTNTMSNVEIMTNGSIGINQLSTVNGSSTVPGPTLLGNAVYIARGDFINVNGHNLTVGSPTAAPQFLTVNHTNWRGDNGHFHGIWAANTQQLNNNINPTLTITGIMVSNVYNSNLSAGYRVDQSIATPPPTHPNAVPINVRVVPGDQSVQLEGTALNPHTPLMQTISPYLGDGNGNQGNNGGLIWTAGTPNSSYNAVRFGFSRTRTRV